jgi:hypothetical protein
VVPRHLAQRPGTCVAMTSPERRRGEQRLSAAAFLSAMRTELRRAGMSVSDVAQEVGQPVDVIRDAVQRRIGEWSCYHRILDVCTADGSTVERLRDTWEQLASYRSQASPPRPGMADTSRSATVVPISRYVQQKPDEQPATVPLKDSELGAATPEAFIALLRRVQLRSGRKPVEIASRAGIPRSTAYRFVDDRKNTALPTKIEQVRAFLEACGLPAHQVQKVMVLWTDLHQVYSTKQRSASASVAPREFEQAQQARPDAADAPQVLDRSSVGNFGRTAAASRADLIRFGLAVACVLTATALTAALVITASGWPAGPQVLAIMLVAVLSTALAASWCTSGSPPPAPARRSGGPSPENALTIEDAYAAPPVIGLDSKHDPSRPISTNL